MLDPVALAQALIRCPSVTPCDAGAQDVLIEALSTLGFAVYDVSSGNVRNSFFRLGGDGPHLCFCGHTDVVPPGDEQSWTHPPFAAEIHDGRLYGRGAADMKGNIACFIAALPDFLQNNLLKGSISLLITGDEEGEAVDGTARVLEWMAENGHIPDAALVGEPTGIDRPGDEIKIGRRGSLNGVITVKGRQGHVAYPHLADNPLPGLARLAAALAAQEFDCGSAFFQPTNLELTSIDTGNMAANVIPEKAAARFNVRFNDHWTAQSLGAKIIDILDRSGGGYEISFSSNAESFITPPGDLSAAMLEAIRDVTGMSAQTSTAGGTSDARFVSRYCPVIECGLVNKTIHQVDEHVRIDDLAALTAIYRAFLNRFFDY